MTDIMSNRKQASLWKLEAIHGFCCSNDTWPLYERDSGCLMPNIWRLLPRLLSEL
jgi:hypothetical protein